MMLKTKTSQSNARKSTTLPAETVEYLKAWMMSPKHIEHPYPTEQEKLQIMADTGIELKPLTNWFVNNRKRYWRPRYEARLQKQRAEAKAQGHNKSLRVSTARNATVKSSRHFLGRKISLGRNDFSQTPSSPLASPQSNPHSYPRAVSIGSASSLSSDSSDAHSFDDDDSVVLVGSRKVEIIVDLKRGRCGSPNGESEEEDYYKSPPKRLRPTKKITVHRIPHHESPRPAYVGKDSIQWSNVCGSGPSGFEHVLPTIEEAALMFGYSNTD